MGYEKKHPMPNHRYQIYYSRWGKRKESVDFY